MFSLFCCHTYSCITSSFSVPLIFNFDSFHQSIFFKELYVTSKVSMCTTALSSYNFGNFHHKSLDHHAVLKCQWFAIYKTQYVDIFMKIQQNSNFESYSIYINSFRQLIYNKLSVELTFFCSIFVSSVATILCHVFIFYCLDLIIILIIIGLGIIL